MQKKMICTPFFVKDKPLQGYRLRMDTALGERSVAQLLLWLTTARAAGMRVEALLYSASTDNDGVVFGRAGVTPVQLSDGSSFVRLGRYPDQQVSGEDAA